MTNPYEKYLEEKEYPSQQDFRVSIYTDKEWEQVQLALALIKGYKANKGRAGYEADYWRGKTILDNLREGKTSYSALNNLKGGIN